LQDTVWYSSWVFDPLADKDIGSCKNTININVSKSILEIVNFEFPETIPPRFFICKKQSRWESAGSGNGASCNDVIPQSYDA